MKLGAGFDPAVSMNACALVVVGEVSPMLWRVVAAKLWQGSAIRPLDIRLNVGPEAAAMVRALGLTSWMSDIYEYAAFRNVSSEERFGLQPRLDSGSLVDSFGPVRRMLNRTLLGQPGPQLSLRSEDPDLDLLCARMAKELAGVTSKRKGDDLSILMPHGNEGAHGDLARALVRALWHAKAGETSEEFDPKAWEELSAAFRSRRAPAPTTSARQGDDPDLFRHPRAR